MRRSRIWGRGVRRRKGGRLGLSVVDGRGGGEKADWVSSLGQLIFQHRAAAQGPANRWGLQSLQRALGKTQLVAEAAQKAVTTCALALTLRTWLIHDNICSAQWLVIKFLRKADIRPEERALPLRSHSLSSGSHEDHDIQLRPWLLPGHPSLCLSYTRCGSPASRRRMS